MQINKRMFKNLDYSILISEILIIIMGVVTIASATGGNTRTFKMQIAFFIMASLIGLVTLFIDYNTIGGYHKVLYISTIILLVLVLVVGQRTKGAKAWLGLGFMGVQPAEFAKLTTIITLAKLMEDMENINTFKNLLKIAFYALLPMVLIQLQPDFGTNMIFAVTILGMLFVAGLDLKFIYGGAIAAVVSIAAVWQLNIIKPYQKDRVMVFLRPELDRMGKGYNAIMAKSAIGSGMFFGMGFRNGNLAGGNFIPESHSDFIFSVFAEEWGFLGTMLLLVLYGNMIFKGIKIAKTSKDKFGCYMVTGIVTMFTFQILQNIGMDIGLMPITGIPLPFMSAGGSSLITSIISVALILNVGIRRNKLEFSRG